jgi:hypothetical protein
MNVWEAGVSLWPERASESPVATASEATKDTIAGDNGGGGSVMEVEARGGSGY